MLLAATADKLVTEETWQTHIDSGLRQFATDKCCIGLSEVAETFDLMGQELQAMAKCIQKGVQGGER